MAHLVIQMEGIAHDGEFDPVCLHQLHKAPEVRMENRVSSCYVEVRCTAMHLTEIKAVVEGILDLVPCHGLKTGMVSGREDIAVLASLVTLISYMPLK